MTAKPPYPQYVCQQGNPLPCNTAADGKGRCTVCQFPSILAAKTKIKGQNQYDIIQFLDQRGNGRLYKAINLSDQSACVIKEYLLPKKAYTVQQIAARREAFLQKAGINLADGRVQNFRLAIPKDAIAPPLSSPEAERYFLVYDSECAASISLKQFTERKAPLPLTIIRNILSQILQSLAFMHQQQFRWNSGQVQSGLLHGNLNLDNILIDERHPGLIVYLCDLHFWEYLFDAPFISRCRPAIAQDLHAVGTLAQYLYTTPQPDQPSSEATLSESQLRSTLPKSDQQFVQRLIGETAPPFETAEQARQALLRLPPIPKLEISSPVPAPETLPPHKFQFRWWMGLLFAYLLICSAGLGWLWFKSRAKPSIAKQNIPCCIDQIANVPPGPVQFSAEKQGTWDFLYTQPHLLKRNTTLQKELVKAQSLLQSWKYRPIVLPQFRGNADRSGVFGQKAMALLNGEKANFMITNHPDDIDPSFGVKPFAYNGIAVFVAFGYNQRENSLPQQLNGKITLKQLQDLYTGKIKNWQEIGGPNRPVKVYFPNQDGLLRIFERQVLVDQSRIAAFRRLVATQDRIPIHKSNQKCSGSFCGFASTTSQLRAVIEDFEDRDSFSIGFDELNKVINQCSVYPLALAPNGKDAISPLQLNNHRPITPATDLCNSKASYSINYQALQTQTYPLTFSLNVVYARDNRRQPAGQTFANILNTQETQCWLKQLGLAPFRTISSKSACLMKVQQP